MKRRIGMRNKKGRSKYKVGRIGIKNKNKEREKEKRKLENKEKKLKLTQAIIGRGKYERVITEKRKY